MPGFEHWRYWIDRYQGALLLLARQRVGRWADAEDVVQEAFIRFWRSRNRVEDPAAFLFACVRRCALESLRSLHRKKRREEATARPESGGQDEWFQRLVNDDRRRLIETAMRDLPAEQREVLVMKIWGGLSFAQIATATEVPLNTAASRYRYAIGSLRGQLAGEFCHE